MDSSGETGRFEPDELAARLDRWFTGHFATFDSRLHQVTD